MPSNFEAMRLIQLPNVLLGKEEKRYGCPTQNIRIDVCVCVVYVQPKLMKRDSLAESILSIHFAFILLERCFKINKCLEIARPLT